MISASQAAAQHAESLPYQRDTIPARKIEGSVDSAVGVHCSELASQSAQVYRCSLRDQERCTPMNAPETARPCKRVFNTALKPNDGQDYYLDAPHENKNQHD
jgi:hypothetical protein